MPLFKKIPLHVQAIISVQYQTYKKQSLWPGVCWYSRFKKKHLPKPLQLLLPSSHPHSFPELLLCNLGWGKLFKNVVSDSGFYRVYWVSSLKGGIQTVLFHCHMPQVLHQRLAMELGPPAASAWQPWNRTGLLVLKFPLRFLTFNQKVFCLSLDWIGCGSWSQWWKSQ